MSLSDILIFTAGIIWGVELIPQLVKTIKRKRVDDISLVFFVMCLIAYTMYTVANMLSKNWVIVIAHIPSLVGNIVMVGLILYYRRTARNQLKSNHAEHSYFLSIMRHYEGEI